VVQATDRGREARLRERIAELRRLDAEAARTNDRHPVLRKTAEWRAGSPGAAPAPRRRAIPAFETVRKNLQTAVEQAQASRNRIAKTSARRSKGTT